MKNLILSILVLSGLVLGQTTHRVGGYISGKSITSETTVGGLFTVELKAVDNSWLANVLSIGIFYPLQQGTKYEHSTVPYGWLGTITPKRTGYVFSPQSPTIPHPDPQYPTLGLVRDTLTVNFTCVDTMRPEVYIYPVTVDSMLVGVESTIKTTCFDNSQYLHNYNYLVSYNNGSTWSMFCTLTINQSARDTSYIISKRNQTFTPLEPSNQCKIRVIVTDYEGNLDTATTPTLKIRGFVKASPIKPIHLSKQNNVMKNYDTSGRILKNNPRHFRIINGILSSR